LVFAGLYGLDAAARRSSFTAQRVRRARVTIEPLTKQQALRRFTDLSWAFEPNVGQTDPRVKYLARADGATVFLTEKGAVIAWSNRRASQRHAKSRSEESLRLDFVGAERSPKVAAGGELPGKTNYLLGRDPKKWLKDVPHYAAVGYQGIYKGVDGRFYGGRKGLEYDLIVSPGGDAGKIRLRAAGAKEMHLDANGNLLVRVGRRQLVMRRPEMYQSDGLKRISIDGGYKLLAQNEFGFRVGEYRRDLPLTIDPSISLIYTTFLGGAGTEKGNSVSVDSSGNIYVGGTTTDDVSFPESSTPIGPADGTSVLFAAKVDVGGALDYLTFIGGSGDEEGGLVAVDNSESPADLAILGWTTSTDFPVTDGSMLTGSPETTVSKLNSAGNGFVYSLYYGGTGAEATQGAGGIAVDAAGDVFITSDTTSTDLPLTSPTPNGFQDLFEGGLGGGTNDGFLAEFDTTGTLAYATYFGISATEASTGVAIDSSGNAYVSGYTSQPSSGNPFPPVGTNSFESSYQGGATDGLELEINPADSTPQGLLNASYIGGTSTDQALAISLDNAAPPNAYVTGVTQSSDLISLFNPPPVNTGYQTTLSGTSDAFLVAISQSGNVPAVKYASYLGGSSTDSGAGVVAVSSSKILVAGETASADFPIQCTLQGFSGTQDAYVVAFDPTQSGTSSLTFTTLLGGGETAQANAVATDANGDAILFGDTTSSDYPLVQNPQNGFQLTCTSCSNGFPDAFLTEIAIGAPQGCAVFNPPVANLGESTVGVPAAQPFNGLLINNGDANLNISDVTITGTNASDFSAPVESGSVCSGSSPPGKNLVPPGDNCEINIQFTPSIVGQETATYNVFDDGVGSPQQLPLTGTGVAAQGGVMPTMINFGNQPQGTQSAPSTVTLTDVGTDPIQVGNFSLGGTNPNDFLISQDSTCVNGGTVTPGNSCTILVIFAPNEPNPPVQLSANLAIPFTDTITQLPDTINVPLSGTESNAPAPIAQLSAQSLSYGSEPVGNTTPPQSVTLTNTGNAPLIISNIGVTGTNSGDFNLVTSSSPCPIGGQGLAANDSCIISATFTPQAAGLRSADITLTDNANPGTQSVALTGTGTAPAVNLSVHSLNFGDENVGDTTGPQSVTVTNEGNANLVISNIGLTGTNTGDFNLVTSQSPCPIGGQGLAPNSNCVITANFKPQATGSRSANITITDNANPGTQNVGLTGTGTAPVVSISPPNISFGSENQGSRSSPQNVTLKNIGTGPLSITQIDFTGGNSGDFTQTNNCPVGPANTLAPQGICTIVTTFYPQETGNLAALLTVADDASGSPHTVIVTGTGTVSAVQFSLPSIQFPSTVVGTQSGARAVQVTNNGSGALVVTSVTFTGPDGGDFQSTDTCTNAPGGVPPGGNCTINVNFLPLASGARTATLNLNDNAPGSPQTLPISGTGTDFLLQAVTGGSTSATVSSGESAIYSLQVTPEGGFTGTVSLGCTNPPTRGTCTISPSSVAISGSTPVAFTASLGTLPAAMTPPAGDSPSPKPKDPSFPFTEIWLATLLLLAVFWQRAGKKRGLRPAMVFMAMLMLSSCNGGGGGGTSGGTPPGTYTVVVTGSIAGTTRTLNLTLIVQR
jgi:Abnormal spindle-like microcephaly-assoc'd, ASPM-SPD-2-Hydin/Beta-propeller repeat